MTPGGKTFILIVPTEGAPDKPERFELEVATDPALSPVLTYSQDGFEDTTTQQLFIDLSTLERLGDIARSIRQMSALPDGVHVTEFA